MGILQSTNLAVRFLLELCALVALGYWGFQTGEGIVMKVVLGIGAPFLDAILWGTFGSPKAKIKLSLPFHIFLEFIVLGLPAIALYVSGRPQLAWIYGICVVINRLFMLVWKQ
jgi:hypothetical protein